MALNEKLFAILKQELPDADDGTLHKLVAMLIVAFADRQGLSLD